MTKNTITKCLMAITAAMTFAMADAQTAGSIGGTILDKNNQQPLSGVTIILKPGGAATTSDSQGSFRIRNIVPGTYRSS